MAEEEKAFYVGVNNPSGLRKELLECSKEVVSVLKNYDKVNSVRQEKIEKTVELQKILAEIKRLNSILKERLPSEKVRAKPLKVGKSSAKKKTVQKAQPKSIPEEPDSEIKKLEDELVEIEDRLNKLGV